MTTNNALTAADLPSEVTEFLNTTPRPQFVEVYIVDVNGLLRGKRLPVSQLPRLYDKGLCLPASTAVLDIYGQEVEATGMVMDTGDADHICRPVAGSLRPLPWAQRPSGQVLLEMNTPEGQPFIGDPRVVAAGALAQLQALGLTPVVATELEFRLFEADLDGSGHPRVPGQCSGVGQRSQLYGLDELNRLDALLADIEAACQAQGLPMDTIIAEQSEGQYEINLEHVDDALLAADHALLLKRTVKSCAQRHGLIASFMAKPFGDASGNGMHVHTSLVDAQGANVFNADGEPSKLLLQAVAGLLETMADATAVFAPYANSYRRFQPGSHAPMAPNWGIDNRTTALRLPLAEPNATRIEHRVAGADVNPYLALAVILGGMAYGIRNKLTPRPATQGNAYVQDAPTLPDAWGAALTRFENSGFIAECFGEQYQSWYAACKRQERERLRRIVPTSEYELYLQTV